MDAVLCVQVRDLLQQLPQPAEKRPKAEGGGRARARPSAASAAAADEESGGGDGGGGDGGDSSDEEGAHLAVGDNHTVKIAAGPHAGGGLVGNAAESRPSALSP